MTVKFPSDEDTATPSAHKRLGHDNTRREKLDLHRTFHRIGSGLQRPTEYQDIQDASLGVSQD